MATKYRADHIGSLLAACGALASAQRGSRPVSNCAHWKTSTYLRVLQRQKDLGFKIFTDGELRRLNFMSDFNDAVEGIDESDNLLPLTGRPGAGSSTRASRCPASSWARSSRPGA